MDLSPRSWTVVDTAAFQRLRGVQQLALTNLVYPGARHSRFEHCLGASHIARRVAERIQRDGVAIDPEAVALAALVHDIGHGPFSHVSEEVFERFAAGRSHIHEAISAAIVLHDSSVREALGDEAAVWIAGLLTTTGAGKKRSLERDIVAGPADIDKLDYLLRDSHFCGVEYGRYDLPKLIESARGITDAAGFTYLGFDEGGLYALEEMLLARYHMHRQVYGHRTRVATDRMLVRAMQLGVLENVLPGDVFRPPAEPNREFVRDYLRWDDAEVSKTLCKHPETQAGEVMQALLGRHLYKQVLLFQLPELVQRFGRQLGGSVAAPDSAALDTELLSVEAEIGAAAGVAPHWVSVHWENRTNPTWMRDDPRLPDSMILIRSEDGKTQSFVERSEVFQEGSQSVDPIVSLYLRPHDDVPLEESVIAAVKEVTLTGLARIGTATLEL